MPWANIERAVLRAMARACRLRDEQVRLVDGRQRRQEQQLLLLEFEQEIVGEPTISQVDLDGGVQPTVAGQIQITARATCRSYSHDADVSALELSYLLLTRARLPEVADILAEGSVALAALGLSTPANEQVDQRVISQQVVEWVLRAPYCELEDLGPDGPSPRPYLDRVEYASVEAPLFAGPPRPLAPLIPPQAVLDAADWRALWLGTQTDLVGGAAWGDNDDVAHNLTPSVAIGSGALDRATSFVSPSAVASASARDAGLLVERSCLVVVLRSAPAAGVLLSRGNGAAGWRLSGAVDGSVSVEALAPALSASLPGRLDGQWRVLVASTATGQLTLREGSDVTSAATSFTYADAPLTLGDASLALAGVELALVGEARSDDPAALLASVQAAVGL